MYLKIWHIGMMDATSIPISHRELKPELFIESEAKKVGLGEILDYQRKHIWVLNQKYWYPTMYGEN